MDLRALAPPALAVAVSCAPGMAEPSLEPGDELEAASSHNPLAATEVGTGDTDEERDGEPTACAPVLEPKEVPLFGGDLILRPPLGVKFEPLDNDNFASAPGGPAGATTCGASIWSLKVARFDNEPGRSLDSLTQQLVSGLEPHGLVPTGMSSTPIVDTDEDHHIIVELAPTQDRPEMMLYVATARRAEFIVMLFYEAEPDDFELLWPTFRASAKTLRR